MKNHEQNQFLKSVVTAMYLQVGRPTIEKIVERLEDAGNFAEKVAKKVMVARANLRQPAVDGLSEEIRDSLIREELQDDYRRLELKIQLALNPADELRNFMGPFASPAISLISGYALKYYSNVEYEQFAKTCPKYRSTSVLSFSREAAERMDYAGMRKAVQSLAESILSEMEPLEAGDSVDLSVTLETAEDVPKETDLHLKEIFLKVMDTYKRSQRGVQIARLKLTTDAQDLFNLAKGFNEAADMMRLARVNTSRRPKGGAPPDRVMEIILTWMIERGLKPREVAKLLADRGVIPMQKNVTFDSLESSMRSVLDLRVSPRVLLSEIDPNTYELYADNWENRIKSAIARRRKKSAPQRRRRGKRSTTS